MTVVRYFSSTGGVRAIVAAAPPWKWYERFCSKTLPALEEDTRVTKGRENETP